jgi:GNAT superfamily N-acetyltransferase
MGDSKGKQESFPILLVSSAAIATVGAGLWLLLRRPCKYLTREDLPPTVPNDIHPVKVLSDEERLVFKKAFLAGDDFRWILAGKDYKANVDEELHRECTFSTLEYFCLAFCERYGHLLVCRDNDGSFLGAVGLIPPYQHQAVNDLHYYRSFVSLGKPPVMSMGAGPAARSKAFEKVGTEHKKLMKDIPHWFVLVVGVADVVQGKGVGTKLMEAAIALAGGVPMCLDCHNGNVPFYEKVGFSVGKRFDIAPVGVEDTPKFEMNCMVRNMPPVSS